MNHFRAADHLPPIQTQEDRDAEGRWITPAQMVAITAAAGMAIIVAAMWCFGVLFVLGIYAAVVLAVEAYLHAPVALDWVREKLGWA